jgi:MinD-like ATPase involved in chromosome partitioning or flagellar assembly
VKLPVLIAAGGAAWEAELVAALERGSAAVTVARRCVDIVDLLAVAGSGQGRAALIAASLRRLDADAVDRLLAADVVPVGVVPRGDSATEDRLRALGIVHLVPDDADPAVVASVLIEAVEAIETARRTEPASRTGRMFGDPATSMAIPPGAGVPVTPDEPSRRGSVIAVWGPTGAPGRTTLAITLADELARLGRASLLVDAEVYGATIAAELGLLDESPGLAAACRLAAGTRLDGAALAGLCWQLRPELRVLTGVPLANRWIELRPSAVTAVLAAARQLADYTVVDCGFSLETDEELSFDSLAPRRNGATLSVLDEADCVIVVGAADPIGMQRLVRALAELRDAEVGAERWVVLNKVRRGVVPGDTRAELIGALEQFAGTTPAALLPYDRESLDAALITGRSLGEARPASPLRRAVVELAANLAGVPVPATRRRR